MTLVSQIIIDALRESNLIALGESGDAAQGAEALRLLGRIVLSVFGNEVGEQLQDWNIPAADGVVEQPWNDYLYPDVRMIVASGGSRTFKLNPQPQNGDRLQLIDAGSDFSTNPITLTRAAAKFEGSTGNYVANTDAFNKIWMYRSDTANWAAVAPLVASDEFPFPEAFDDAFILMLATRLNPRYQQSLAPESLIAAQRAMSQLKAAYARTTRTCADLAVLWLTGSGYAYGYGGGPGSTQRFLNGNPY